MDSQTNRDISGSSLSFAVVGFGYWGPNIVRNIQANGCEVKYIVDALESRRDEAASKYPECNITASVDIPLNDSDVDAVVIVLPVSFHYPVAKQALESGKHVLVEKPICNDSSQALKLIKLAESKNLTLMVDHTYVYSPHIRCLADHFRDETLLFVDSERMNLGRFQRDVNVVWDLAVHDLAILGVLQHSLPVSVSATGAAHTTTGLEDISSITIHYKDGFMACIRVSWISPVKSRRLIIGGNKTMAVFDDTLKQDKVRIFDSHIEETEVGGRKQVNCIPGESWCVDISDDAEVLSIMLKDFEESIRYSRKPRSDAKTGYNIVRLIEAIQQSIRRNGEEVTVDGLF